MGTSVDRAAAGPDLYKRGEAIRIKGDIVDSEVYIIYARQEVNSVIVNSIHLKKALRKMAMPLF